MEIEDGKSTQEAARTPRIERSEQSPLQQANAEFWKSRRGTINEDGSLDGATRASIGVSYDAARKTFDELASGKNDRLLRDQPDTIAEEYGDGMAILLGRLEKGEEFQRLEKSHPGALDPDVAARTQREYGQARSLFMGAGQKLYPDVLTPTSEAGMRLLRMTSLREAGEAAEAMLRDYEQVGTAASHGAIGSMPHLRSITAELATVRSELVKGGTPDLTNLISRLRQAAGAMGSDFEMMSAHEHGEIPFNKDVQRFQEEFVMRAGKALYTLEVANNPIENAPANPTTQSSDSRAESNPNQLTPREKDAQNLLDALVNLEKSYVESNAQKQSNTPATYDSSLQAIRKTFSTEKKLLGFLITFMTDLDSETSAALSSMSSEEMTKYPDPNTLAIVAGNRARSAVMERLPADIKQALAAGAQNDRARQEALSRQWAGPSGTMGMIATTSPEVFVSELYKNFQKARLLNR